MNAVNVYLGIEPREQRFFAKDDKRCSYQVYELCPDGRLVNHYMKDGVSDHDRSEAIEDIKKWGYEEVKKNA